MWVLKSRATKEVVGKFKSQAAMAKHLGLSQQFVNRKIRKEGQCAVFKLDKKEVVCQKHDGEEQPKNPKEKVEMEAPPPPKKVPPVPAPRRKNLPPPVPAPRPPRENEEETGYTELMEMKTWEILENKYPDFWCKDTVGSWDETIMLLFHVVTGEYVEVKNYQNIDEFFKQRGYSSYLTEKLFDEKKRVGEKVFQACRGKKKETWFRLILCKTEYKRSTLAEIENERKEHEEEWKRIDEFKKLHKLWLNEKPPPLAPPPEEVVEIQKAGQTINFENSAKITSAIFESPKVSQHISGQGFGKKYFGTGPKNKQTVIIENKEVYLPDLVKEIIVFHIRGKMWKEGDSEEMQQWVKTQDEASKNDKKNNLAKRLILMRNTRNLSPMAICEITKKLAGFI